MLGGMPEIPGLPISSMVFVVVMIPGLFIPPQTSIPEMMVEAP
jgi:hypothetical protein